MSLGWPRQELDFGERLQPNVTKSVLVARINENVSRLYSWRSTDVKIDIAGVPVDLSAQIAVQTPRSFRLRATSIRGEEADIGSNDERLWFWMRDAGRPEVVTVRHEHVGQVRLPIPFQPDWLMEVMGVIPLDESQFILQPVSPDGTMSLIGESRSPSGQPVTRIVRVESNYGLVLGYSLVDAGGRPIATATLGEHRRDPVSHAILPRRIHIDWPQARMSMTLRIGRVEINPPSLPEPLWQIPSTYPQLDLSRQLPRPGAEQMPAQPVTHVPAAGPGPAVVTAQLEEPPWDDSAIAAVSAADEQQEDGAPGRARVTLEASPFLPPRRVERPWSTEPPGRVTYGAF